MLILCNALDKEFKDLFYFETLIKIGKYTLEKGVGNIVKNKKNFSNLLSCFSYFNSNSNSQWGT